MKNEDWVSFNRRTNVCCGKLICRLEGGQEQCNSFPHDTSNLVSVCCCFWLQSWVAAGSLSRAVQEALGLYRHIFTSKLLPCPLQCPPQVQTQKISKL